MKKVWIAHLWVLVLLFKSNLSTAQQTLSAIAVGLGETYSTIKGDDATANLNPAGIGNDSSFIAGIMYNRSYLLSELDRKSAFVTVPFLKSNSVSGAYEVQGFELYKKERISFSYSKKFGKQFSVGLRNNYYILKIGENYGKYTRNEIVAGLQAQITSKFGMGVLCTQPIAKVKEDPLKWNGRPQIRIGISYQFSELFSISSDGVQDQGSPIAVHSGINYRTTEKFFLRGGIIWNQMNGAFGCSFLVKNFKIGMDVTYHRQLGFSPVASIIFSH